MSVLLCALMTFGNEYSNQNCEVYFLVHCVLLSKIGMSVDVFFFVGDECRHVNNYCFIFIFYFCFTYQIIFNQNRIRKTFVHKTSAWYFKVQLTFWKTYKSCGST